MRSPPSAEHSLPGTDPLQLNKPREQAEPHRLLCRSSKTDGAQQGEIVMDVAAKLAGIVITLVIIIAASYLTLVGA